MMRRVAHRPPLCPRPPLAVAVAAGHRGLMMMPSETQDPELFPRGFVPVTAQHGVEEVYQLARRGHYICSDHSLARMDKLFWAVQQSVESEVQVSSYATFVHQQRTKEDVLSRLLLKREFWEYEDYSDPELNQSAGPQNFFFDNYAWATELWKEFQAFAEKHYPLAEHTHISVKEYYDLIRSFKNEKLGVRFSPMLPKSALLHPKYKVPTVPRSAQAPYRLYTTWLHQFAKPLRIRKALVVRGGCGLLPFTTRRVVPMVRTTEPSLNAVESMKADQRRLGKRFSSMSFQVEDMFPSVSSLAELRTEDRTMSRNSQSGSGADEIFNAKAARGKNAEKGNESDMEGRGDEGVMHHDDEGAVDPFDGKNGAKNKPTHDGDGEGWVKDPLSEETTRRIAKHQYDMIAYAPPTPILPTGISEVVYEYAPQLGGVRGDLEHFFEKAGDYLTDRGVVVVLFSNAMTLTEPNVPHPIEHEVKSNRRWLVLDYYDFGISEIMSGRKPGQASSATSVAKSAVGGAGVAGPASNEAGARGFEKMKDLAKELRAELWVLHRVENLHNFGWVHEIPGCTPPSSVAASWRGKSMQYHRAAMMRRRVEAMGGDWGEYKNRLAQMLKANPEDEDEVAQAVRMTLDPTYTEHLAQQTKQCVLAKLDAKKKWEQEIADRYQSVATVSAADFVKQHITSSSFTAPSQSRGKSPAAASASPASGFSVPSPRAEFDEYASQMKALAEQTQEERRLRESKYAMPTKAKKGTMKKTVTVEPTSTSSSAATQVTFSAESDTTDDEPDAAFGAHKGRSE